MKVDTVYDIGDIVIANGNECVIREIRITDYGIWYRVRATGESYFIREDAVEVIK